MVETKNVPHDLILGVLAGKLPVKSLLRFKCVCKTWCYVISYPQFCNNFHPTQPSILICQNSKNFSTITVESLLTSKKNNRAAAAALTPLPLPWEDEEHYHGGRDIGNRNHFIGSCNGLVCVDRESKSSRDLILWNPSTRKFRRLPPCSQIQGRARSCCVWFGYDESIDDYKLVWLMYHIHNRVYELNVFTLKSNTWTWRTISMSIDTDVLSKGHDKYNPRNIGVLSNGAIHWRVCFLGRMSIFALDLATEKFRSLDVCNYPFDTRVGGGGSCILGPCMYDDDGGGDGGILEIVKEYPPRRLEGIVSPNSGCRRFYQTLLSMEEGTEILAVIDMDCSDHRRNDGDKIVKLRIHRRNDGLRLPLWKICCLFQI